MHNVKKSPASEAQLAARTKERDHKLREFLGARNLIFSKRQKNELDEELLALTGGVLEKNPDIYTLWNIRRDTINVLKEKKADETDEEHAERLEALYDNELKVTLKGIEANPKSYSAWYHRAWTLQHHRNSNLTAELALCEKSLMNVDCRNFHCWDHRRLVAKLAGFDSDEELAFSDRLITRNPSNYSAWHYRGTLLQQLQKEKDPTRVLDDDFVVKELKTIKNICCYNFEDQTAWTYCRWLCEALCTKVEVGPTIIHVSVLEGNSLGFVFSQPLTADQAKTFIDLHEKPFTLAKVSKFRSPNHKYSVAHKWILKTDSELGNTRIKINDKFVTPAELPFVNVDFLQKFYSLGSKCESEESRAALTGVVEMCEGLIEELKKELSKGLSKEKEDIPWHILMLARTLILLHGYSIGTIDRASELLKEAIRIDSQRRNVYAEMSNKLSKIRKLCQSSGQGDSSSPTDPTSLFEYFKLSKSLE